MGRNVCVLYYCVYYFLYICVLPYYLNFTALKFIYHITVHIFPINTRKNDKLFQLKYKQRNSIKMELMRQNSRMMANRWQALQ